MLLKSNTKRPVLKPGLLTIFLLLFNICVFAQNPFAENSWWMPDANVKAMAMDSANHILYIGGDFTGIYPKVPYGSCINRTTGIADPDYASPNGPVYSVIPDGNGGWYIGGAFTKVGQEARNHLAQISAAGTVTTWNPDVDGDITALALAGNTLYAGGVFTNAGGQSRSNIAAIDITNGQILPWNPGTDNSVRAIAVKGNTVFLGGSFTSVDGQARDYIASVNAASGQVTSWNPGSDQFVFVLAVKNNNLYAGGQFTSIGGQARNNIAAIDISTGQATSWNPDANAVVNDLVISGANIYITGDFDFVGGQTRISLAALDTLTGLATSWAPGVPNPWSGSFRTIALGGGNVYIGGDFIPAYYSFPQPRKRIAAFDINTGALTSWSPDANGSVRAIAVNGNSVYAGGTYTGIGGVIRNHAAAIDVSTGIPTPWTAEADATINALAFAGNTLYAGGGFTIIGGQNRNYIAALSAATGAPTSWDPVSGGSVATLLINGTTVYAGGAFTTMGGQGRNKIAAIDASTGVATAWNPTANNTVSTLAVSGNTIYAGGSFTNIGGQARNRIAALDITTGLATSWNPNAGGTVSKIIANPNTIYAGGSFTTIGGQPRNRVAALSAATGLATSWNPNASTAVSSIAVAGSKVFVGGGFSTIGGQTRGKLAVLDTNTGLADYWNPGLSDGPSNILINGNTIYISGNFTTVGGEIRQKLAAFNPCTSAPAKPGTITQSGGAVKVCPGETRTYTVPAAARAYSYDWSVPTGATIMSGQGSSSVQVSFDNMFGASGTVEVRSKNDCGTSLYRSKLVSKGDAPTAPGAIVQTGGEAKVCPGETRIYTISSYEGITNYNWIVPAGATITSGQGTTSITVLFDGSFVTSDIQVAKVNGCGTGAYKARTVIRGTNPGTPSAIIGDQYGVCSQSGIAYTVVGKPGLTYAWSFDNPDGTVASGQGTSSVNANFAPAFVSGVLSVTAANGCGISNVRKSTIYAKPNVPGSISGASTVCAHTAGAYSIAAVPGATDYTWSAPPGSHITDGITTSPGASLTTTHINVMIDFGATSGDVKVRAGNSCANSKYAILAAAVNSCGRSAGVEPAEPAGEVEVYPNPAANQVNIRFTAMGNEDYTVHLYNIVGKEVILYAGTATEGVNQVALNTSVLAAGVYHLVLRGARIDYNTKVVLDK